LGRLKEPIVRADKGRNEAIPIFGTTILGRRRIEQMALTRYPLPVVEWEHISSPGIHIFKHPNYFGQFSIVTATLISYKVLMLPYWSQLIRFWRIP
jgi:hypothetical protein